MLFDILGKGEYRKGWTTEPIIGLRSEPIIGLTLARGAEAGSLRTTAGTCGNLRPKAANFAGQKPGASERQN